MNKLIDLNFKLGSRRNVAAEKPQLMAKSLKSSKSAATTFLSAANYIRRQFFPCTLAVQSAADYNIFKLFRLTDIDLLSALQSAQIRQ